MISKFHICATWHLNEKHGQNLYLTTGLARFFMPCQKGQPTSWHKGLSDKGYSHVVLPTVLTDGVLPTWQTTCPSFIGLLK